MFRRLWMLVKWIVVGAPIPTRHATVEQELAERVRDRRGTDNSPELDDLIIEELRQSPQILRDLVDSPAKVEGQ